MRVQKSRAIEHVEGSVDPIRDLEIISYELIAKDRERVKQALDRANKLASKQSSNAALLVQLEAYRKAAALLEAGTDVREGLWTEVRISTAQQCVLD